MKNNKLSKTLSYILRHKPEKFRIKLDKNGWAYISDIINALGIDNEILFNLVRDSDKQRFLINSENTKIRANQGHSIKVDLGLDKVSAPSVLYHGTKKDYLKSIKKTGLVPMNRNHVHLSGDIKTAEIVASRRKGDNIILKINAKAMQSDGIDVFISDNGVYLVDKVLPKYLYE